MTQATDGDILDDTDLDRAVRVGQKLSLLDIRLRRLASELHHEAPSPPFTLKILVVPTVAVADQIAIYEVQYEIAAEDKDAKPVFDAEIALNVIFQVPETDDFAAEDLHAFGRASVVYTVYPYLREMLHSLTSRMGLPPLVLEVARSPLDLPRAESAAATPE